MGQMIEVSRKPVTTALTYVSTQTSTYSRMPVTKLVFPGAPRYNFGQYPELQEITISEQYFDKNTKKILPINQETILSENEVPFLKIYTVESELKDKKIIYFHGNAQNVRDSLSILLPIFKKLETTIYVMEYPKYGNYKKPKDQFLERLKSDCIDFHQCIKNRYNIEEKDIYIIGRSIGTGVASFLSQHVNCQRLLLISPFDSIKQMGKQMGEKLIGEAWSYLPDWIINILVQGHFDNTEAISKHKGDLMVIHGKDDQVIDLSHARNLVNKYNQTNDQKCDFMKVYNMGHNNIKMSEKLLEIVEQFLLHGAQKGEDDIFV